MYEFETREMYDFWRLNFLKKYMVGHNGFIAGGCFKNILSGEKAKDIDMWFRNESDYNVALHLYENSDKYELAYKNNNTTAFRDKHSGLVIELIKKNFLFPVDIMRRFDFTITKFCMYKEQLIDEDGQEQVNFKIIHHKDFFEHLYRKQLVLESDDIESVYSTFERTYRYTKYGYTLCKESKKRLISAIRKADELGDKDLSISLYDGFD